MLEATITKAVVVHKGKNPTLMGVAEYYGEMMNFKVNYDWDILEVDNFVKDLRDKIAEGFEIPVYCVDIREDWLLDKMKHYDLGKAV